MIIFKTERLIIKSIENKYKGHFIELLSNPKIIDPAPHQKPNMEKIMNKFELNLKLRDVPIKNQDNIWGVFKKGKPEMIGIAAILTNDEGDWEMGYRLRVKYWGNGFGTELADGILKFCFKKLKFDKITADVDINNKASVKILDKIMSPVREFYHEEDKCLDRRYEIKRKNWLLQNSFINAS